MADPSRWSTALAAASAADGAPLIPADSAEAASRVAAGARGRSHILTVALEDYFHVTPFKRLIDRGQWYRFEMRLEHSTRRTLDLLDSRGARATFFVLGWVADAAPELVREVSERGHEIASKGYYHQDMRHLDGAAFRDDAVRAREALERACGRQVLGYRVPQRWFEPADLWALEVLAEAGYTYDSSIKLVGRAYAAQPWCRFAHRPEVAGRPFLEVPLSSLRLLGLDIPIAGGNYFRQLPYGLMKRAVAHWDRQYAAPYVMYFHTWELDPDQPRLEGAPLGQRIRQYRNLEKMPAMLAYYLATYSFTSIAQYFGLDAQNATAAPASDWTPPALGTGGAAGQAPTPLAAQAVATLPVTVVIPCYNEEQTLPYLRNTLRSVAQRFEGQYTFTFLFVDDCSTDGTWSALPQVFGSGPNCRFIRHERNCGVAAAIHTGIEHAADDVVCSIDCDCTYDPHELGHMIPLLANGVAVVTASPYHPAGRVKNVPGWRLFLSKSLSRLYRLVLRQRLSTYTSCFRVYRRSAALSLRVQREGFLGVAEMLGRFDLGGHQIVEYPTTLEVRILGRSKMKVLRTVVGHLGLLADLARARVSHNRRPPAPPSRP